MNCVSLLQIWNVSNGELLHLCAPISVEEGAATHGGWVTDLCFSPDTKMLVSAGGYLKVRDSQRLKEKSSLYPTFQAIFTSCVSVGPHTTHQKGGAVTITPFWVSRWIYKAAFLRSFGNSDDSVRDILRPELSYHPIQVLDDQNDQKVGCLTGFDFLLC